MTARTASGEAVAPGPATFRDLHRPGSPVVLPNAWDASSARTVVEAGFPAVATASAAVSPTLGFADHEAAPVDEVVAAAARVVRSVDVPVSIDIERGYGLPPAEIGARLTEIGAAGCNLEDTDARTGQQVPVDEQVEFLTAFRASAPDLVLNARVDTLLHGKGEPEELLADAIERGRRYVDAGADCIYPMAFRLPPDTLKALIDGIGAPINAVFLPGTSLKDLAAAGAARVSYGPGLFLALQQRHAQLVARVAAGEDPYSDVDLGLPAS